MTRVTIRETTPDEREQTYSNGTKLFEKYVAVNADDPNMVQTSYFMPVGGSSKPEAVYWAERHCSHWGFEFVRPEGWEKVRGALRRETEQ